jgi:hypothetical protein
VGRWLQRSGHRDDIVLARKVYQPMGLGPNDRRPTSSHGVAPPPREASSMSRRSGASRRTASSSKPVKRCAGVGPEAGGGGAGLAAAQPCRLHHDRRSDDDRGAAVGPRRADCAVGRRGGGTTRPNLAGAGRSPAGVRLVRPPPAPAAGPMPAYQAASGGVRIRCSPRPWPGASCRA